MFRSLLKQFLKISTVVAVGTSVVLVVSNAQAAKPTTSLSITEASWAGNTLTIKGRGASNVQIDAWVAGDITQTGFLGSDTPGNNGRYTITNSDVSSSTVCRVHVEQFAGDELKIAEAVVTGNAFCDDPPPPNDPPVCTIDSPAGDVTILVGDSVDYAGTATDTTPGVIQSTDWTFEGGTP